MSLRLALAFLALSGGAALAFDSGTTTDVDGLMQSARAAIDAGDYATAIADLRQVVAEERRNADALNLLGYASRKSGALDQAAEYYDAALSIDPDHLGALEYQGELFIMTGDIDAARANLARLVDLCGSCEEQEDLAEALAQAGS